MDFNPENVKLHHLFGDTRTILFHSEPGYRVFLTNLGNGEMAVQEEWDDLQVLFDQNAAEAAEFSRTSKHGDMVKVASVPVWVQRQWEKEANGDKAYIRRKLNDADNAKFRVNDWRV